MSAVMNPQTSELLFKPTPDLPRRLSVELSQGGYLYVYARVGSYTVAHTCEPLADTKLFRDWKPATLIVGNTHFHLTEPEAAEIERAFGPLGLAIRRTEPQP